MAVDLFLLCGFLGSGKTTLLVDYLRDPASRDTGVIVNEAGEVGVDGAIVQPRPPIAPISRTVVTPCASHNL